MITVIMTDREWGAFEEEVRGEVVAAGQAAIEEMVERFGEMVEAIGQVLRPAFEAVCEAFRVIFEAIDAWVAELRRWALYVRLQRWLPRSLARWVALHLPRRWLPWPSAVEWMVVLCYCET